MSTRSSDLRTALIKRKPVLVIAGGFALLAAIIPIAVLADDQTATQAAGVAADTVWVIVTGCLVMFMQAGFAMLEVGFSRMKNVGTVVAKVVTNDEIPESPDASSSSSDDTDGAPESSTPGASSTGKKTAEQWKAEITVTKARIAALQSHVDKLNDSVHFVEANRYYNGVQYNQYQLKKQQEAQRLQKQLETEKKALEDAKESARKAGFGSAVYDPVN